MEFSADLRTKLVLKSPHGWSAADRVHYLGFVDNGLHEFVVERPIGEVSYELLCTLRCEWIVLNFVSDPCKLLAIRPTLIKQRAGFVESATRPICGPQC